MTAGFCDNDDCLEGWHWTQLGEFPEPCPEQVVEEPPGGGRSVDAAAARREAGLGKQRRMSPERVEAGVADLALRRDARRDQGGVKECKLQAHSLAERLRDAGANFRVYRLDGVELLP